MSWEAVFFAMLPEHALLAGIVALIIAELVSSRPRSGLAISLAAVALSATAATWLHLSGFVDTPFAGQYSVATSDFAAKAVVLLLAIPVLLLSRDDVSSTRFHVLVLSSLYGVCLMLSAESFLTLFLGIELMSLPVYVLVLIAFRRNESVEAALKYLVLSGAATATFLMGVSLLYGGSGSMALSAFANALSSADLMSRAAVVLIVVAFFLKAAVVPFHAWAPDAYEAASVPVTGYMATIVKAAVLLAAVRLFGRASVDGSLADLLALLPLVSIVWGNLTAMRQTSFRRMIAYSSIAHAGYLYYAFLGAPDGRFEAVLFYVLAYALMNLLAFASLPTGADDASRDRLESLKGLFARNPYAALAIGIAMLSLAGIPPLPGFVAKFLIFKNVIAAGYTTYAVAGLVGSYLGIYFYLRVIQFMFMGTTETVASARASRTLALGASVLCLVPSVLLIVLPGWVIGHIG
jgi:NADH-quinone oxidoreductase subunit N